MKSVDYHKINHLLTSVKNILITSHHNPDGDAVGSALALYNLLKKENYNVDVILPNGFPGFLKWMTGSDEILIYNRKKRRCDKIIESADLIFCLDYNALSRVGDMTKALTNAKAPKIMIDHHLQGGEEFDFVISTIHTSSTAELVYDFIGEIGLISKVDKSIAECIYTGIMTDTGSFSYSCNYRKTFEITAELLKQGIDIEKIHRLVYDTYSEERMRLLGFCLSERLVVIDKYRTAYIYLSKEDLDKFNYRVGDTEGVVNYALSIEKVVFAALITMRSDHVRISFRSKGDFSVNDFARKHFEGGGHKNAAGGNCYLSLDEAIKKFENLLPLYANVLSADLD